MQVEVTIKTASIKTHKARDQELRSSNFFWHAEAELRTLDAPQPRPAPVGAGADGRRGEQSAEDAQENTPAAINAEVRHPSQTW